MITRMKIKNCKMLETIKHIDLAPVSLFYGSDINICRFLIDLKMAYSGEIKCEKNDSLDFKERAELKFKNDNKNDGENIEKICSLNEVPIEKNGVYRWRSYSAMQYIEQKINEMDTFDFKGWDLKSAERPFSGYVDEEIPKALSLVTRLCAVDPGSIVLVEHPEAGIQKKEQAVFGDVILEVSDRMDQQLIVETNSETLLRRIQRRIAERLWKSEDLSVYCKDKARKLRRIEINDFGHVICGPEELFDDTDMSDIIAHSKAVMKRRMS